MEDEKVAKRIAEKKTRIQKVKEVHERKTKERNEKIALTKAQYQSSKDDPVILDILAKAKSFAAYHTKIAQDGIAYRVAEKGKDPEVTYLTNNQRVSHLDKSGGIGELIDYIERQFQNFQPQVEQLEPAEDEDESTEEV